MKVWGLCLYRCRGPWVFYAQCGGGCKCMECVGLQVSVDIVGVWVSGGCGYI